MHSPPASVSLAGRLTSTYFSCTKFRAKLTVKYKFLGFRFKKRFLGLMYEDRAQNYDPEIHEECVRHTPPPATSFIG